MMTAVREKNQRTIEEKTNDQLIDLYRDLARQSYSQPMHEHLMEALEMAREEMIKRMGGR